MPAPEQSSDRPDVYTHGHHASVVGQHARRTAERDAAFLLPRLRPGMRLLDVGCGPGSITIGLARAVAPGETVGTDVVPEVVEEARARAAAEGVTNLRFAAESIYGLSYPDASFDVAYAHQVLQHLARPVDALREMARVLRPGGLVAVRDADYATMVAWPKSDAIDRWLEVYHAVATRNWADADAGRRLPSWVRAAGFADIEVTGTVQIMTDPASTSNWGESWADRTLESSFGAQAMEYGIATRAEMEAVAAGWRAWAADPEAFFMYTQVEVIGLRRG
ncbi:MAG: methyltransferase domain-containing protein [Dehalococcoidia bacterium]|nr:methyltransferase domain-containing protein [Dehalococcoidia bacterium]